MGTPITDDLKQLQIVSGIDMERQASSRRLDAMDRHGSYTNDSRQIVARSDIKRFQPPGSLSAADGGNDRDFCSVDNWRS